MEQYNTWPGWECVRLIGGDSSARVYEIRKNDVGGERRAALKVIHVPQSLNEYQAFIDDGYDNNSIETVFRTRVDEIGAELERIEQLRDLPGIVRYDEHMIVPNRDKTGWDVLIRMDLMTSLPAYINENEGISESEIVWLGIDIACALESCGKAGIIHRDIKPQNILIDEEGHFRIGDFRSASDADIFGGQIKPSTYSFMAPEVFTRGEYSSVSDLYSLGLVLYWAANERRLPFLAESSGIPTAAQRDEALRRRLAGGQMPGLTGVSPDLAGVIARACAADPEDRYASATEFRAALEEVEARFAAEAAEAARRAAEEEAARRAAEEEAARRAAEEEAARRAAEEEAARRAAEEEAARRAAEEEAARRAAEEEAARRAAEEEAAIAAMQIRDTEELCPVCGQPIEKDDSFCTWCGSRIIREAPKPKYENKFCTNCGRKLPEGTEICPYCYPDMNVSHDHNNELSDDRGASAEFGTDFGAAGGAVMGGFGVSYREPDPDANARVFNDMTGSRWADDNGIATSGWGDGDSSAASGWGDDNSTAAAGWGDDDSTVTTDRAETTAAGWNAGWQQASQGSGNQSPYDNWQSSNQDNTTAGGPALTGQIMYRVKCPSCGRVQNVRQNYYCQECGTKHSVDLQNHGFLQIYRMGNYMGMASPESIYLNGEGMGMIGNTETAVIELPPGVYNLHVAMNMLRNCDDIMVRIEPGKTVYVKSQLKMGMIKNKIVLFEVSASEMPPLV